jgi:hypothetical protein
LTNKENSADFRIHRSSNNKPLLQAAPGCAIGLFCWQHEIFNPLVKNGVPGIEAAKRKRAFPSPLANPTFHREPYFANTVLERQMTIIGVMRF